MRDFYCIGYADDKDNWYDMDLTDIQLHPFSFLAKLQSKGYDKYAADETAIYFKHVYPNSIDFPLYAVIYKISSTEAPKSGYFTREQLEILSLIKESEKEEEQ